MVGYVPLCDLAPGQTAVVHRLEGRAEHVHRLTEVGLAEGTPIRVFRSGNPCILQTSGGKFCLRTDSLVRILVRPVTPETP